MPHTYYDSRTDDRPEPAPPGDAIAIVTSHYSGGNYDKTAYFEGENLPVAGEYPEADADGCYGGRGYIGEYWTVTVQRVKERR